MPKRKATKIPDELICNYCGGILGDDFFVDNHHSTNWECIISLKNQIKSLEKLIRSMTITTIGRRDVYSDRDGSVEISLKLDGEVISSDYFDLD